METAVKRLYEGLFLVDSALAAAQWEQILGLIGKFLDRAGADVISIRKWDERKLAYTIRGKTRGTYILAYFNCDPERVAGIERDVQLSEQIMRVLVLRGDKISRNDMEKATPFELNPEPEKAEEAPREAEAETPEEAAPEEEESSPEQEQL